MSASLVGSEMCIRDRGEAARAVWRLRRELPPPDWRLWRAGGSPPRRGRCLLYTSDAADDM
eukprot:7227046-Alexandrium_andersonii.AAC.1